MTDAEKHPILIHKGRLYLFLDRHGNVHGKVKDDM